MRRFGLLDAKPRRIPGLLLIWLPTKKAPAVTRAEVVIGVRTTLCRHSYNPSKCPRFREWLSPAPPALKAQKETHHLASIESGLGMC